MITEFGGAVAVPSAVRNSDSTTTIRVNDVIMTRIDGAIDSTVSSAISWIARSVTPPLPWPRLMLISCANAGPASDPAAISVAKNKTLRGKAAGLTKGSLDGPATTPSRLRDFQSRSSARVRQPAGRSVARRAAQGGLGGGSGATGGAPTRGSPASAAGRRRAASSRCAISARFWSAPTSTGAGGGAVAAAARRHVPVREPGAAPSALRSDAAGAASRVRCARSRATASVRGAARGGVPDGRPAAPARTGKIAAQRTRCAVPTAPAPGGALRRQRRAGPAAAAARAFAARRGRRCRTSTHHHRSSRRRAAAQPGAAVRARRRPGRCGI